MKVIKSTSKLGAHFLRSYSESNCKSIFDAYSKPSDRKISIYFELLKQFGNSENGRNFKIISASCHHFTVAWEIESGVIVITPYNKYMIINND